MDIVSAVWQNRQLTPCEMMVKGYPLFHLKEVTPVWVDDQGRTPNRWKQVPQVECPSAIRSAEFTTEFVKVFGPPRAVPVEVLPLYLRGQIFKGLWEFLAVKFLQCHLAMT